MRIARKFTDVTAAAWEGIGFAVTTSEERAPDDRLTFENDGVEVPAAWGQLAADSLAKGYFRQNDVPVSLRRIAEEGVPEFLWRSVADEAALAQLPALARYTCETSARHVIDRMVGAWAYHGWKAGYFTAEVDARAYMDEMRFMLAAQMAAPSAAHWAVLGLDWAYGIAVEGDLASAHIAGLSPDLPSLANSGAGVNYSALEGQSAGMMARLRALDAVTAGGGMRRTLANAAFADIDHPEIEGFINWKTLEEQKVSSLIAGSKLHERMLNAIFAAIGEWEGAEACDPRQNPHLKEAIRQAKASMIPEAYVQRVLHFARQGFSGIEFPTYDAEWDGEAFASASGQRSLVSLCLSDAFMQAVEQDAEWELLRRADGSVAKRISARDLWDQMGHALWSCADQGAQFSDSVNAWNTCAADGAIEAASLEGEFQFLNGSAAVSASLNLRSFLRNGRFDAEAFVHACRLWVISLDISQDMRAESNYRPLALGHSNLAALLMSMGLAYDSASGRAMAAAVTSLMTAAAYEASAAIAARKGAFERYDANAASMMDVIRNHHAASYGNANDFIGLNIVPLVLDEEECPDQALLAMARLTWDDALSLGEAHGFRNAQVTGLAPWAELGLLMEAQSNGAEPDQALVKFKSLAKGGFVKVINPSVPYGLRALGYGGEEIAQIVGHALGHRTLENAPGIDHHALLGHGFGLEEIEKIEAALPQAYDIRYIFNQWTLGREFCQGTLGIPAVKLVDPSFDLLRHLGFTKAQIEAANAHVCGAQTLEGAPLLKAHHLPVFDCAKALGASARMVSIEGHILMAAALQPFISGGVAKHLILPHEAGIDEGLSALSLAHHVGLKSLRLEREGAALSSPLVSGLYDDLDLPAPAKVQALAEKIVVKEVIRSHREKLPERRKGYTQKASIGGQKVYLRTGEYCDGGLGEIFIDMHKETDGFRAMLNNFAIAISMGLQYGVPLREFVEAFTFTRFEPAGTVQGNDSIKTATSVLDYIFRELAVSYLDRTDLAHVAPKGPAFDDIAPEVSAFEAPEAKSVELLKSISSAGYLRKRLPRELLAFGGQGGYSEALSAVSILMPGVRAAGGITPLSEPSLSRSCDGVSCVSCGGTSVEDTGLTFRCCDCGNTFGRH